MNKHLRLITFLVLTCSVLMAGFAISGTEQKGYLELLFDSMVGYKGSPERFNPDITKTQAISEISLERTECFGICSVYTVRFFSDGRAVFDGRKNVEPLGHWEGTIPLVDFTRLADAAIDISYFDLAQNYQSLTTDRPTVFTSLVINNKRKIIRNYGNAAPPRLWLLELAIDQVRATIEWKNE